MAGCTVDRNIFTISYDNLSSEIASQHADWTPHQVRIEAARLFRSSYRQNMESVKQEFANEKEYMGTPFVFENGEVNFVDGLGMTNILTFHENQLRDTPEKYSPEQHETSLLIQTAFQNGATEVVTSYLEPNGQRDIVVMTLDRTTGKGKMRIINTLTDHTMPEMQNIIQKIFSHLYEVHPATNAFIFSDTRISKVQIQQKGIIPARQTQTTLKETINVSPNTIHEIRHTMAPADKYIQRVKNDRVTTRPDAIGDSFIYNLRRMFERKKDKDAEVLVIKKHELNLLGRPPEEGKNEQRIIREKIVASAVSLLFIRVTGVGIGGTGEFLNTIARLSEASATPAKHIRKENLKRDKYTEVSLKRRHLLEKMRVFRMSEAFKKLAKKEQRTFRRKERSFRVKEKKIIQHTERRNIRRKEVVFRRKEKQLLQRKEQRGLRKKEEKLWEIVLKLVKKGKTIERKSFVKTVNRKEITKNLHGENRRHSQKQEKQHVVDFSVALAIWLLLQIQGSSRLTKEMRSTLIVNKHEKLKTLLVKDPAPWLLFAIIWYLAMIREQGARRGLHDPRHKRQTVQQQKMIQRGVLPPMGIIFAFAS